LADTFDAFPLAVRIEPALRRGEVAIGALRLALGSRPHANLDGSAHCLAQRSVVGALLIACTHDRVPDALRRVGNTGWFSLVLVRALGLAALALEVHIQSVAAHDVGQASLIQRLPVWGSVQLVASSGANG